MKRLAQPAKPVGSGTGRIAKARWNSEPGRRLHRVISRISGKDKPAGFANQRHGNPQQPMRQA
jgi:hypothetical protein